MLSRAVEPAAETLILVEAGAVVAVGVGDVEESFGLADQVDGVGAIEVEVVVFEQEVGAVGLVEGAVGGSAVADGSVEGVAGGFWGNGGFEGGCEVGEREEKEQEGEVEGFAARGLPFRSSIE